MATRRRALSLSALIRTRAIQRGIFGSSPLWRAVAVVMFGRRFLKKVFGKHPDYLGTEKLKAGQLLQIEAIPPSSRRGRRGTRRRTA
jgi:hypothetical protein